MSVRVRELAAESPNTYYLAATAVDVRFPPPALRGETALSLRREDERTLYQRVAGGDVVEVAVFARWVNAGSGSLETTIRFDGLEGPGPAGSTATFGGESSGEARWGEPPLTIPPGRDGVGLPIRSLLAATHANLEVRFDGRAEPLALTWSVKPDSVHPASLEGNRDALIALGTGFVPLDRGESVTCDLHAAPELEDFLDDSFCRLYTPAGEVVDVRNISSGPFRLTAPDDGPSRGWYRLEFSVFGNGREFLRDTAFCAPEIIRSGSYGRVTPYADPIAGRAAGADSTWNFDFPRGWGRDLWLRTRGLPEGGVFTGSLSLKDRGELPPLLWVPLRADTRGPETDAEPSIEAALDRLEEPAERLLSAPPFPSAERGVLEAALASLDRADALQKAWDGASAENSTRWWDRVFRRCDLRLRHAPDDADARREIGRALEEREGRLAKELPEDKDRRRAGRIALRRAALALAEGDAAEARQEFDEADRLGCGRDEVSPVKARLLVVEKKPLEAVTPMRAALRADPWNPGLAREAITLWLDLGWVDLADEALAAWPDRFPRETVMFLEAARRRTEVRPAAETREVRGGR
jgi:hypothetical protein